MRKRFVVYVLPNGWIRATSLDPQDHESADAPGMAELVVAIATRFPDHKGIDLMLGGVFRVHRGAVRN
jgi:hypothetical protein